MIASLVKVESRQPQPPLLGPISPVADLDSPGHGTALLRIRPAGNDEERHSLTLVPIGDRFSENPRPGSVEVTANLKRELRGLTGPMKSTGAIGCRDRRLRRQGGKQEGRHEDGQDQPLRESPGHVKNSQLCARCSRALNRIIASLMARDRYVFILPCRDAAAQAQ